MSNCQSRKEYSSASSTSRCVLVEPRPAGIVVHTQQVGLAACGSGLEPGGHLGGLPYVLIRIHGVGRLETVPGLYRTEFHVSIKCLLAEIAGCQKRINRWWLLVLSEQNENVRFVQSRNVRFHGCQRAPWKRSESL